MSKKKFYVVWNGHKKGVFTSWKVCKKQIDGSEGAQYKSFADLNEAEIASTKNYADYIGKNTKKPTLSSSEKVSYGAPNLESISVDAACSGNPGKMEYRGVLTHNKQQIFIKGPFKNSTQGFIKGRTAIQHICHRSSKLLGRALKAIYGEIRVPS